MDHRILRSTALLLRLNPFFGCNFRWGPEKDRKDPHCTQEAWPLVAGGPIGTRAF